MKDRAITEKISRSTSDDCDRGVATAFIAAIVPRRLRSIIVAEITLSGAGTFGHGANRPVHAGFDAERQPPGARDRRLSLGPAHAEPVDRFPELDYRSVVRLRR